MKRILPLFSLVLCLFYSLTTFANANCSLDTLSTNPHQVIECYVKQVDVGAPYIKLESVTHDKQNKLFIEQYTLVSQTWPKPWMSKKNTQWSHTLTIFRPEQFTSDYALLIISGGTRNPTFATSQLQKTAGSSHTVVAMLDDEPNQYLTFEDGVPRKEDSLIAYSFTQFLNDPYHNVYWSAHIPMVNGAIKAMDAVQNIINADAHRPINHFVVTGASKRGWAAWLTALVDDRVSGIAPVVVDTLDTTNTMHHVYDAYGQWPVALHDYVEQKVTDRIDTPEFAKLMQIEDPMTYLQDSNSVYRKRLSVPKLIVSASGDDFTVPDSMNNYVTQLPGETNIHVVPNQSHYIDPNIAMASVFAFFHSVAFNTTRPHVQWTVNTQGTLQTVTTDASPESATLWEAINPDKRDFRLNSNIRYQSTPQSFSCNPENHCQLTLNIKAPAKGFKANFVEFTFINADGTRMTMTTPVYIISAEK